MPEIDAPQFVPAPGGTIPARQTRRSVGYDMHARGEHRVSTDKGVIVPCGFRLVMPPDMWAEVRPRSSALTRGLIVQCGTIDADYDEEVGFVAAAIGGPVHVEDGSRWAQIVFHRVADGPRDEAPDLPRRSGGFGSTGA